MTPGHRAGRTPRGCGGGVSGLGDRERERRKTPASAPLRPDPRIGNLTGARALEPTDCRRDRCTARGRGWSPPRGTRRAALLLGAPLPRVPHSPPAGPESAAVAGWVRRRARRRPWGETWSRKGRKEKREGVWGGGHRASGARWGGRS